MIRSVLAPLDGSRFAEFALPPAVEIARRAGARLRLALIHESPAGVAPGNAGAALAAGLREREEAYLQEVAGRLDPSGTLPVETLHQPGSAGPALVKIIEEGHDDLVVMATHGRGPVTAAWLGSVADYVLRHATVPVLLLRPEPGQEPVYGPSGWRRILVPLDASPQSEVALSPALDLLDLFGDSGVRLTLLTVVEPVLGAGDPGLPFALPPDPALLDTLRLGAERRLEEVAAGLSGRGLMVDLAVQTGVQPAHAILETAREGEYELIAMTTHGAGGLRRLLLGSVADKVIRASSAPVLVVRPGPVR